MRGFEHTNDLQGATVRQRFRVFGAETLGLGSLYTRLAVWGELDDKRNGSLSAAAVQPVELARFKEKVERTSSEEHRYALLSQPIPTDKNKDCAHQRVWFDVIPGLTEQPIIRTIASAAHAVLPPAKSKWQHAGDLGAGVGAVGAALLGVGSDVPPVAERLTLIDRVPSLLGVASQRYGAAMEYMQADVTAVPAPSHSFDLLTSGGLVYSLGAKLQDPYFGEVSRLLKPGGTYIDGDYTEDRLPTEPNDGLFHLGWLLKGNLATREMRGNPLDGVNQEDYFSQFGLAFEQQPFLDATSGAQVNIRTLTKT
jgi:SAM-dependent methyltransferase